jgi:serine/threonine protein kinase
VRGTLRYLAPEIFAGAGYSVQSDLWSLGVVLFEALLARPAVTGNDVVAMGRICVGDLLELQPGEQPDPRVLRAVSMLLQKRPEDRPRSAREAAAVFAMHEKTLVQENARASSDDARSAVFLARLRTEAPTLEHLEPEPPEPIDDHGLPFPEQDEPPFARLLVTEADPTHPPLKIAPAGSTAVDDLRAYAASLSAMEKQLHHVELADESAAAAARARSAILQDTTLWAPPPGLAADLALLFVNGDDFAEPPETVHQTPSRPSPFLPQPASLVPPRVFDEVITVETPARARSAAGVMPAIEKNRSQREDVHQMIDAFLVPDDTPTPTLSPLQHRRALAAAGTAPVVAFAPTVLQRAALALLLIGFGTAVAVAAALLLR